MFFFCFFFHSQWERTIIRKQKGTRNLSYPWVVLVTKWSRMDHQPTLPFKRKCKFNMISQSHIDNCIKNAKDNILFPFVWKLMKSGAYNTFFTNSAIEYCYQWKRCNRHVMISSIEVVNHCQINIINIMCMWAWGGANICVLFYLSIKDTIPWGK